MKDKVRLNVLAGSVGTYVQAPQGDFKALPEIYQVELTNRCNLKCPMCLRTTDMDRPEGLLDISLLRKMVERGDFGGSFYVELQMAGEPTLHPHLREAIDVLKYDAGVLVGLSTHGLLIGKKAGVLEALMELDALTISVDSLEPDVYAKLRYPAKLDNLLACLSTFFTAMRARRDAGLDVPFVELQLINTKLAQSSGDTAALEALCAEMGWSDLASVRTTEDSFDVMQGRSDGSDKTVNVSMCINPFMSVSVTQDGTVVSCCFVFDPTPDSPNVYGNLTVNSLAEVWAGRRVADMQAAHAVGSSPGHCASCYLRSPVSIHLNIVSRLVRAKRQRR